MFTGIVEELGSVVGINRQSKNFVFKIKSLKVITDAKIGESIAVNGVCLTVVKNEGNLLYFEAIPETLKVSNLGSLKITDKVNLERSLKLGGSVSGHFVTGHIDCMGVIRKKTYIDNNFSFEIAVPQEFIRYIIPKGSVAADGVSLTVMKKTGNAFLIYIIPHTLKNTTFGLRTISARVNVEFDILTKHS